MKKNIVNICDSQYEKHICRQECFERELNGSLLLINFSFRDSVNQHNGIPKVCLI